MILAVVVISLCTWPAMNNIRCHMYKNGGKEDYCNRVAAGLAEPLRLNEMHAGIRLVNGSVA